MKVQVNIPSTRKISLGLNVQCKLDQQNCILVKTADLISHVVTVVAVVAGNDAIQRRRQSHNATRLRPLPPLPADQPI